MSLITRTGDYVEGVLVPFAGPDDDGYGTWWDRDTDFALGLYEPQSLLYLHGLKDLQQHGRLVDFGVEDDGLHVRGIIRRQDSPIYELVDRGEAAWSSGSMAGVASPARADGYIARWPIVEGSIAHYRTVVARTGLTKADYVRAGVGIRGGGQYLRSVWTGAKVMDPKEKLKEEPKDGLKEEPKEKPKEEPKKPELRTEPPEDELAEFRAWKEARAKEERKEEMRAMLEELGYVQPDDKPKRKLKAEGKKSPVDQVDPVIRVASPYDQFSLLGMAFHHESKAAFRSRGGSDMDEFDDKFFRAMLDKINDHWKEDQKIEQEWIPTPKGLLEVIPMRAIDHTTYQNWHRAVPHLRANEAMMSTLANRGDELVPTLLSSTLYYFMRLESRVAPLFRTFRMPGNPFDYPKITKGPTFVKGDELSDAANFNVSTSNIDYSQISTDDVQFNAGKLAAITLYSEELVEDSTVAWAEAAARVYVEEMAHSFDYVLLNGDTSASATNISYFGTDPSSATATKRILTFDGIRKGIVAADQTAVATIDDESILSVMATMGPRGIIGRDIRNLVCVAPPEVGYKLDALDAYESLEKVGSQATLLTGQLGFWRSVPVIVTEEFPQTDANGRVDDTASQNSKGAFVVANRNAIMVGMRRMPQIEQAKIPGVDGRFITASLRADVNLMEEGAAAMGYNSTV